MDNWQKEIFDKLENFIASYPPSNQTTTGEEVTIGLNSKEVYVLVNIINQWNKLNCPLVVIEPPRDFNFCEG